MRRLVWAVERIPRQTEADQGRVPRVYPLPTLPGQRQIPEREADVAALPPPAAEAFAQTDQDHAPPKMEENSGRIAHRPVLKEDFDRTYATGARCLLELMDEREARPTSN